MNCAKFMKGVLAFLSLIFLVGCGNKETDFISKQTDEKEVQNDYIYATSIEDIACVNPVRSVCTNGDILYIMTYNEEANDNRGFAIDCLNRKSKPFSLPLESESQSEVQQIAMDNNGNLAFIEKYMESEDAISFFLKTASVEDWSLVSSTDITDIVGADRFWLSGLAIDKDGNFYISGNTDIMVLTPEGKELFTLNPNTQWFVGMSRTKDGRVAYMIPSIEDTKGLVLNVLDAKEKGVVQSYEGIPGGNSEGGLAPGVDSDLLVNCNGGVYRYNLQDGSMQEELRWTDSTINSGEVSFFAPLSDGNMVAVLGGRSGSAQIAYLAKTSSLEVPQKEKLVLASFGTNMNPELEELVNYFNSCSTEYYVEIRDYRKNSDSAKDAKTQMVLDMLSDEAPDIIDAQVFETSRLAAKGGVEDLTPFLENDPEMEGVEFFDSVLALNSVDGKLYSIPDYFSVYTLAGREEELGQISGLTLEEFIALVKEHSEGRILFKDMSREYLLQMLITQNLSRWVNWETGECSFESDEFKGLLEFCREYGMEEAVSGEEAENAVLHLRDVRNGLEYKGLNIILGGAPAVVGFPVAAGMDSNGSQINCIQKFMICSNSENKQGAWEFIKCFVSQEYYDLQLKTFPQYMFFPSRIDVYNQLFDEWMQTKVITDENGVEQTVGKYEYNGEWGRVGRDPVTEEDREAVTSLIENAYAGNALDGDIFGIIVEETAPYFFGQKSVDEVTKIIQSRVKMYVNENK